MRTSILAVAVLGFLVTAAPVHAQQTAVQSPDEQAIRTVVQKLFDGMRTRDTTMMKTLFAAEARFYGVGRTGAIQVTTPAQFITSIGAAPAGLLLDEVLGEVEVRIDGPLASVWTYYDFFAGDNFSHCGYDAFQLLKTGGEWKIVALADSRRTEGCLRRR